MIAKERQNVRLRIHGMRGSSSLENVEAAFGNGIVENLMFLHSEYKEDEMHTITDEFVQNLCHGLHLPLGQVEVVVNTEVEN